MKRIFKRTKTEKTIRNIYLVAFILLLISYLFTLYSNKKLVKQSSWVERTHQVIRNLDNLLNNLADGETGVRGYVLTKNIQFLFPYYGAEQRADSIYQATLQLTHDSPEQQERLPQLKELIDKRFEILQLHIRSFDANGQVLTDSLQKFQYSGKELMDNIRERIGLLKRHESRLLEERGNHMAVTTRSLNTITIVSLTLAISLLFFGLITYMQVSKERKKGLAEIEEYQSRLNYRIIELDEANTELIKMRSLEKFAATGRIARTIAHEIRNPLTNINLATDQLKEELRTNNENTNFLFTMITRNSSRINQLISDLLNSTKFTDLNYEATPLNDFVEETLKEAEDRIALNHITVTKKYSPDLCDISIDRVKMKIALLNIIINAIEAMENREGSELVLETRKEANKCKIIIGDNGQGVDKESLSRIFEPYYTSKKKGNGLGLTNTQNIILNHSGEISVESTRGKGTNFTIILALNGTH